MRRRPLRLRLPQRLRTRLTLGYTLLFLLAGSSLLAVTYALLASRLPAPATSAQVALADRHLLELCKRQLPYPAGRTKTPPAPRALEQQCKRVFAAGATAAAQDQRSRTLSTMLLASGVGLGVITVLSAGLGWILAGRALRPVKAISAAARRASDLNLEERLALDGPADELKELADTFDEMLERLDRAFTSQRRFVANAAHELRTPVTAMRTSIEVTLSKESRTPEQLEAMAAKIQRSLARLESTVDALLALAATQGGTPSHEPFDLATAIGDALDISSGSIAERGLTVEAALEPAPTCGDPVLVERLVANLIDNAVRHNTPGGWIRVHSGHTDGESRVEIVNTGPRIAPELVPALFEPFARAEQRLNPDAGVGLGLSLARAIATAHGATLTARARPDGGLELSLVVPRHVAKPEPAAPAG